VNSFYSLTIYTSGKFKHSDMHLHTQKDAKTNSPTNSFYKFRQQRLCCIFNTCCVTSVLLTTVCCLCHHFIFFTSILIFFINQVLKFKYQPSHLKVNCKFIYLASNCHGKNMRSIFFGYPVKLNKVFLSQRTSVTTFDDRFTK
jgi:hypothetical protein